MGAQGANAYTDLLFLMYCPAQTPRRLGHWSAGVDRRGARGDRAEVHERAEQRRPINWRELRGIVRVVETGVWSSRDTCVPAVAVWDG
eukprot:549909-Prymnesium_polylepis.1